MLTSLISFAAVAGLLTITPGLDTALVLRAAIRDGRRHAFVTALGIGSGSLVWGAAAALGVTALLTASTLAYSAIRLTGAAFLLWLGGRLLWTTLRPRVRRDAQLSGDGLAASPAAGTLWNSWRRGVLTNLLNPKIGMFYVMALPAFLPASGSHLSQLSMGVLLALVHDVEGLLWFSAIIVSVDRARRWLQAERTQRVVDAVTGSVLVGFGATVAVDR